jgi:predicted nuclease of predicted toxin-antitoxin system
MRFKVDENLPIEVAEMLRQAGYDAATVLEQRYGGSADAQVATLCQRESRVLVTLDIDFAHIRNYPPTEFPGLIVLRLRRQDKPIVLDMLARLIKSFAENRSKGICGLLKRVGSGSGDSWPSLPLLSLRAPYHSDCRHPRASPRRQSPLYCRQELVPPYPKESVLP